MKLTPHEKLLLENVLIYNKIIVFVFFEHFKDVSRYLFVIAVRLHTVC